MPPDARPLKVLFVSRLFDGVAGGVERMAITLMNALAERGHVVELLSWDQADATAFYPMRPDIKWHKVALGDANQRAGFKTRIQRLARMREIVDRTDPDVILAFQQGAFLSIFTAVLGLGKPVIAAERNAPQRFEHLSARNRAWLKFLTLRMASVVTVQFESYRNVYPKYLRSRIVAIPNPVTAPAPREGGGEPAEAHRRLLCVARLSYQKNIGVLIAAFARLAAEFPDWRLVIVGEGEDISVLTEKARAAGVLDRVSFEGAREDVAAYYEASDLFCLPSRWEGFPNAIAEAMTFGLPCVGFEGCAGVNELIQDNETGLLAAGNDQPDSLASTLKELMGDPARRRSMGAAGSQFIRRYEPEKIYDSWISLMSGLVGRRGSGARHA